MTESHTYVRTVFIISLDTVLSTRSRRTVWLKVDLLVVGCTHHEDALHAEGVGDVRSRAGALCPPTIWGGEMEAASYGEYRVVLHTTCFRLQLHQIGAVSCYDRCWVHHRCRNLTVPELQVAPNRSRHPNAIMRLEPKVILTVVLRLNVTSLSNMKSPF